MDTWIGIEAAGWEAIVTHGYLGNMLGTRGCDSQAEMTIGVGRLARSSVHSRDYVMYVKLD